MSFEALPDGWRVWNEEPSGRAILVYRPDVFGGDDLPSACLPTIYLTNGARNARPGSGQYATDEWHVVLFLEPEIEAIAETYERARGRRGRRRRRRGAVRRRRRGLPGRLSGAAGGVLRAVGRVRRRRVRGPSPRTCCRCRVGESSDTDPRCCVYLNFKRAIVPRTRGFYRLPSHRRVYASRWGPHRLTSRERSAASSASRSLTARPRAPAVLRAYALSTPRTGVRGDRHARRVPTAQPRRARARRRRVRRGRSGVAVGRHRYRSRPVSDRRQSRQELRAAVLGFF